ncbi:hypothetical protein AN214_01202 [Pseudoalteromonas sp. P1-9]|uniref:N,N-dimethylformamidase beta subunit family domain-containing protein n=1 Tax=Pseudoalteromonas sp. P1-9 TaxID=1710354 RepID=UPI0006D60917|nr:N,N-dimethylformamidase beta subunit family domain-containing protein [Pseudoalteromonas sp. P1-9]KPV96742.1 hypothetical protein AN214_01202 [Pseudoalteromonas sp. P1-9]
MKKILSYISILILIASCGKNSGENQPPVIDTLANIVANEGDVVTLPSTISDPDGNITDIQWRQTSGVSVQLENANQSIATFTAPRITQDQTLFFEVVARDNKGASSQNKISVKIVNYNFSPEISLIEKQTVMAGEHIVISAEIQDKDGEVATIQWNQTQGPSVKWNSDYGKLYVTAPSTQSEHPIEVAFNVSATDDDGESTTKETVLVITPLVIGEGQDTDKDGYSDSWERTFQFDYLDDTSKPFDQELKHKKLLELEQSYQGTTDWHITNNSPKLSAPSKVSLLTFTDKPWYNKQDSISIYASGKASNASIEIFRFGYYGGALATLKYKNSMTIFAQDECKRPIDNSYYNRCDWKKGLEFKIPRHWLSGLYMLKVKDEKSQLTATSLFLIQGVSNKTEPNFWEDGESLFISAFVTEVGAYNVGVSDPSIGASFYRAIDSNGKSVSMDYTGNTEHVLGFKRPQTYRAQRYVLLSHLSVIANFEKENFAVTYMSDWEQNKELIKQVIASGKRTIIDVGHSEYHTDNMRQSIEVLSEVGKVKWLSINAANTRFEKILKGSQCGEHYADISDDIIFCRPNNRTRTKFANTLSDPETKYFGSRYVAGSSGSVTPVVIDPSSTVIKGDTSYFYKETDMSPSDFPFEINNYGFIETDTRLDDAKYGHVLPFENSLKDFLIIGKGFFPNLDTYSVDPTYIRLINCSQLLHGASLGSGFALTPKESLETFAVGREMKGEYNLTYARMINNFIKDNDEGADVNCH